MRATWRANRGASVAVGALAGLVLLVAAALGCSRSGPSDSEESTGAASRRPVEGTTSEPGETATNSEGSGQLSAQDGTGQGAVLPPDSAEQAESAPAESEPAALPLPEDFVLDLETAVLDEELNRLVQTTIDGHRVVLTLDPDLQAHLSRVVARYPEPAETLVAIEPSTGRVLAWVEDRSELSPTETPLLSAEPWAASVFKIVTATMLLERGDVRPDAALCVPPARRGVEAADLSANAEEDTVCVDLTEAMADSVNVYFARLAAQNLSAAVIDRWLERFGFNQPIPFELPVPPSVATTPDTNLERARMAAGFRHVHLSPLHGAMIAGAVANRGQMMRPTLVLEVRGPLGGEVLYRHQPSVWRRVMSAETAERLTEAMSQTTVSGTASRYFAEREGWPSDLAVAGKTGTLSDRESGLTYSWFVGFGPIDEPQIAVAGLVYNTDRWHIKGAYLASEAIVRYHENRGH